MPFLLPKLPKSPWKPPKSTTGGLKIYQIFPNSKLAVFGTIDYEKC